MKNEINAYAPLVKSLVNNSWDMPVCTREQAQDLINEKLTVSFCNAAVKQATK